MTSHLDEARQKWHTSRLAPLWESASAHKAGSGPVPSHIWRWAEVRPLMDLAFQEASPAAIERRVLQMIGPDASSLADERTCGNVLAAFQCLLPGETARPHRHTMNALRFMLEGENVLTYVDGKECSMAFGDLVLTPGMTWHEHKHEGSTPAVWLDVLDVPLHQYLGTVKFEPGPIKVAPFTLPDLAFTAPSILPIAAYQYPSDHSPVFRYPYADACQALAHAPRGADGLRRVRYINPTNGQGAIKLLDCVMTQLDAGLSSLPTRTNANQVITVVEGRGSSTVGDRTFTWGPRDVFTVPQHNWITHSTNDEAAKFFVVSDADVLRRLNLLTEEINQTSL